MLQSRGDAYLACEPRGRIARVPAQLLDGDLAVESAVARFADATDPAAREFSADMVVVARHFRQSRQIFETS
jgi:hypothetical protein